MDALHARALLNDFAIRSFRDMGDNDYIAARLSFRAALIPQFEWQSLQAIEKYLKCILVLNRIKAQRTHELLALLHEVETKLSFPIRMSNQARNFITLLDARARFRYFEASYQSFGNEVFLLDKTIWELRRYARVLDYDVTLHDGSKINLLANELRKNEHYEKAPCLFCITGGVLEKIVAKQNHPSRVALVWKNRYFGKKNRAVIKYIKYSSGANAPLSLHPEILDEVLKYVFLPKDVVAAYRALAATP